ncbi:hypothetical protein [Alcanivorax sp.]|uniref:hypothetical protein n=1 Tax=Alcanivorax sp. TaxID=1872427 RepID=UPI0025B892BF|nr:hypothetical protein [Alcanivorax sp.]
MKAKELLGALRKRLGTQSQTELAAALGVTVQTIINWNRGNSQLKATSVANAILKSRDAAIESAQYETIQPLVEFYRISKIPTSRGAGWQVFDSGKSSSLYARGLKFALDNSHGIYIFYDTRGKALYVGKAKEQSLWKEINSAFVRPREVQKILLPEHPSRNQEFKPGYEKLRQPKSTQLELCNLAAYFSAYQVVDGMIDDLEALMVRGFANDVLNTKMETFAHSRK